MDEAGTSLEGRFMALAEDLAKQADGLMAPESYGQWADETYRLMAAGAEAAGADGMQASGRAMTDGVVMMAPAAKASEALIPMMEDVYGGSANAMTDGYYFLTESMNLNHQEADTGSAVDGMSQMGGIAGLDVLDPDFLCTVANGLFKSGGSDKINGSANHANARHCGNG